MLAAASALLTISAIAAEQIKVPVKLPGVPMDEAPVYNPAGDDESYMMSVTEDQGMFGVTDQSGYKMTIRRDDDGATIWFRDLTPGYNRYNEDEDYTWIKGTVNGTDITVKAGQVVYQNDFYDQKLYIEAVTVDEYGTVSSFLDDIHFTISGERIVQTDNSVYLAVYEDGETTDDAGMFIFMNNFVIEPTGEIPSFNPPATADIESRLMTWDGGNRMVKVARDNETIYIAGLSELAPDDFVPGTVENDKLTIKSGYILSSNPQRYIRLIGATEGEPDEWGFPSLEMTMTYTFDITSDGSTFTLNPAGDYIVEASYDLQSFYNGFNNVKIFPYDGDKPAVPATPSVDYNEYDDILHITIPATDKDGNYINSDLLTYRVEFDGVPYEFSPDSYFGITDPMVEIPYGFSDWYDFYANGDYHTIYLHDVPAWTTVEVVSTYTVDGVANSSSSASQSGINSITSADRKVIEEIFTDLTGRRLTNPAPGSIVIRSTRYDDGTVVHSKIFIR